MDSKLLISVRSKPACTLRSGWGITGPTQVYFGEPYTGHFELIFVPTAYQTLI